MLSVTMRKNSNLPFPHLVNIKVAQKQLPSQIIEVTRTASADSSMEKGAMR